MIEHFLKYPSVFYRIRVVKIRSFGWLIHYRYGSGWIQNTARYLDPNRIR